MNFSTGEMVDMIWVLGACEQNCLLATRLYSERYPERRQPDTKSFQKLKERFEMTGDVAYKKKERKSDVVCENNELEVLLKVFFTFLNNFLLLIFNYC